MLIARLIADPATLETRLEAATRALAAAQMPIAEARMLDACSEVLELSLPHGDVAMLRGVLDEHFAPSDAIIARDEIRVPDLFVSDMDSTMIGQECIAPMPGARTLVATLKHRGCRTVLVTGGFHHFADPVAADIGFERVVANRLAVSQGMLAGELVGGITDASVKAEVLQDEMARLGDGAVSLATGDGANDIPMLQAATYGVAYRAKPKAREAAGGWIDRGDLTSLLKLLEIPRREWVMR